MAETLSADFIDLSGQSIESISGYDLIGLASGCFFGSMHEKIIIKDFEARGYCGKNPMLSVEGRGTCVSK